MFSFWEKEAYLDHIDHLVIGAGIVGISTAIYLRNKFPNAKILVLDRGVLPNGASTKNAGFACVGSPSELLSDLKKHTESEVIDIVKQRWEGLQNLKALVGESPMDYRNYGGYELYKSDDHDIYEEVQEQLSYLNLLMKEATNKDQWYQMSPNNVGLTAKPLLAYSSHEGQINPVSMMSFLHQKASRLDIRILQNMNVKNIDYKHLIVSTKVYEIKAKNIFICTNAFTKDLLPNTDLKPARNQVLMTKPISNLKIKGSYHYNEGYIYFRNYGDRILLGGARNMDLERESTDKFANTSFIKNELIRFLKQTIIPNQTFEIEHWWSGIIAVGSKKSPIVEKISDHVYKAVRLSGIGVAIGSKVAKELVELVE